MRRDLKILAILLVGASIYFYLKFNSSRSPDDLATDMLSKARKDFGKPIHLPKQNNLDRTLDSLLSNNGYSEALQILDTASMMEEIKLNYRGEICFKQGKLKESIEFFNKAVALGGRYSISVANRAKAYSEMQVFDSAVIDYRSISYFNYDYYRPLAETFEKKSEKDSAIKYYRMFLDRYPDSISVQHKIEILENGR
jgi:tetratricopeptide (TPR) repeat protein